MKVEIEASPMTEDKKKEYGKWDKWEIESCADCLIRAEEIKADPEKMKYVKQLIDQKYKGVKKVVSSIKDVRAAASEVNDSEGEEESED